MSLKDDALEIKNEVNAKANTADRVGSYLENSLNATYIQGWWDYNNSAVAQNYITPNSDLILTNDGLGIFTDKNFAAEGIIDIWNASTNSFDFTDLTPGDTWECRLDITVNTDSPNQNFQCILILSYGNLNVEVPFLADTTVKTQNVDTKFLRFQGGYIKNATIAADEAKFIFRSDDTATIKLNGFYFKVHKKSKQTL